MSSIQPQVVVGIDFGMTFTGVAYSRLHMPQPFIIQKWPPRLHEVNRKVPSVLHYPRLGGIEWGFPCQYSDDKQEWFKRYLDPAHLEELRILEPDNDLPRIEDVRKWYRDYMRCLYSYISQLLQDHMGDLNNLRVEWVFSLPTTFQSQEISNTLMGLLREAGFGQGFNHTIDFGLTEPQASAVDAAKYSSKTYESGDIMLVCDAGGGTTDFALLEQTTSRGSRTELQEIATVPGIDIGSTNIDTAFETLVDARLRAGGIHLAENTSWTMMHSQEFQTWKCNFGHASNDDVPLFPVRVPFLDGSISNREAKIESGMMLFSHTDFRKLFEPQVSEIVRVIRQQLDRMIQTHPGKSVNYLILSGGLGSSPYLLKRLRSEFILSSHPVAPSLDIILSDEPQLAVCRGLVIDRMQRIMTKRNVLAGRICPASYGVLCDMPYDSNKHVNQTTYKDPLNGLLYVRNQVLWMIKKGQPVDIDSHIAHNFTKIVGKLKDEGRSDDGSNRKIWKNKIVISYSDAHRLPSNASHADCFVLANVTSNLSSVPTSEFEVVKEHKSWYKKLGSRDKYRIAEHEVRIVIGSSDIKFELWFKGEQYNRANSIRVEWLEGASISAPKESQRVDSNILDGIRKRKAMKNQKDKNTTAQAFRNNLRSPRSGGSSRRFDRG